MDLLLAWTLAELSGVFVVAGWVTYLQNEKGVHAEGGSVAEDEDEDDEVGATPEQSDAD